MAETSGKENSLGKNDPRGTLNANDTARIDPQTGLPLPDPYVEYIACPYCNEQEVEVFCYQTEVVCHNCNKMIVHTPPATCGTFPFCKRGTSEDKKTA